MIVILIVAKLILKIVMNSFKENFNKAREFNKHLKAGEESKLVMAPVIVEKKEEPKPEEKKVEPVKEKEKEKEKKVDETKK